MQKDLLSRKKHTLEELSRRDRDVLLPAKAAAAFDGQLADANAPLASDRKLPGGSKLYYQLAHGVNTQWHSLTPQQSVGRSLVWHVVMVSLIGLAIAWCTHTAYRAHEGNTSRYLEIELATARSVHADEARPPVAAAVRPPVVHINRPATTTMPKAKPKLPVKTARKQIPVPQPDDADTKDAQVGSQATSSSSFGSEPFDEHWSHDGTTYEEHSFQSLPDGSRSVSASKQPKYFDQHNEEAYRAYSSLYLAEKRATIAKRRGDLATYTVMHERARVHARDALAELQKHLEWLALHPGEPEFVGDRSPSNTYSNMAFCQIVLGEPDAAVSNIEAFMRTRPYQYTASYTCFNTALLLAAHGYLAQSNVLMQAALREGEREWGEYNQDQEYRVITWHIFAEVNRLQGDVREEQAALTTVRALVRKLSKAKVTFVRDRLWTLGITPDPAISARSDARLP